MTLTAPAEMTLSGDRQTGKTHAGLLYAGIEAQQGNRVLYESTSIGRANHDMYQAQDIAEQLLDAHITRRSDINGRYVLHFQSGGYIHFRGPEKDRYGHYDVHVIEDNPAATPANSVKRVIRIVTTNT